MNVKQRQAAADPQTKPPDLGCRLLHRHLLQDFSVLNKGEGFNA